MGICQDELSRRMAERGVRMGRVTIAKIESGRRAVYDMELLAFSRCLGVPASVLMMGGGA